MDSKARLAVALRIVGDAFKQAESVFEKVGPLSRLDVQKVDGVFVGKDADAWREVEKATDLAWRTAVHYRRELEAARSDLDEGLCCSPCDLLGTVKTVDQAIEKGRPNPTRQFGCITQAMEPYHGRVRISTELYRLTHLAEDEAEPVLAYLRLVLKELRLELNREPKVDEIVRHAEGNKQANLAGLRALQALGEYGGHVRKAKAERYR
jgi:hypothetical protein